MRAFVGREHSATMVAAEASSAIARRLRVCVMDLGSLPRAPPGGADG